MTSVLSPVVEAAYIDFLRALCSDTEQRLDHKDFFGLRKQIAKNLNDLNFITTMLISSSDDPYLLESFISDLRNAVYLERSKSTTDDLMKKLTGKKDEG